MKTDDIRLILGALNDAQVNYLVVGGLAVVAHGYVRFTQDIDVVIQLAHDNILRAMTALTEIGYRPLVPVAPDQFANDQLREQWRSEKGMIVFQMLNPDRETTRLDIFVTEPFPFDEEYEQACWENISGVRVPILRIQTLIAMKEAAGRMKDLADAELLRDIVKLSQEKKK